MRDFDAGAGEDEWRVMIRILSRIFIKDYKSYEDAKVRRKYGILCGVWGIILNIFLFGTKYLAGVISGSVAITADAFNNLSDAGSSFITLFGFYLAGQDPDREHPFGHGRIEYVAGLVVSLAIILMGFDLGKSSLEKIFHPVAVETGTISFVILLIGIGVKAYMAFYNHALGKKLQSATMRATATDSLSDVVATTVVLLSMLILKYTGFNVDGFCGILVAAFILFAGYQSTKETLNPLLGNRPAPELIAKIGMIVKRHKEVVGFHNVIVHDYGPGRLMISLHAEVPGDEDVFVLHELIELIESELEYELDCECVIHMDPVETRDELVNQLREEIANLVRLIDPSLTIHDFRVVHGSPYTKLFFDIVLPQEKGVDSSKIRDLIAEEIRERYPGYVAVIKMEKDYV